MKTNLRNSSLQHITKILSTKFQGYIHNIGRDVGVKKINMKNHIFIFVASQCRI